VAIARRELPAGAPSDPAICWHFADLAEAPIDYRLLDGVAAIVNLAGTGFGRGTRPDAQNDPAAFVRANELATIAVLSGARADMRVVHASSQVIYGTPDCLAIDESCAIAPATPYAVSKRNGEDWVRLAQKQLGNVSIALRFTGFIEGGGLVDYLIERALADEPIELFGKGEVCRDYLTVADGVQAIQRAIQAVSEPGFHPLNIGAGQRLSAADLARLVVAATGSASEIRLLGRPSPQSNFVYDISRARRLLGFAPSGMSAAVERYAKVRAKGGKQT
jgi:UDP-glucose 4-epimerase